jgi:intracellular multiplication protein IcmD
VETTAYKTINVKRLFVWMASILLIMMAGSLYAATPLTVGNMASSITESFANLTKLITGGCYLAGLAFAVTAVMKFKQHKDNPTQIPIGTPVALVFIAAALLFMPSILNVAGYTMFGSGGGQVAGPSGAIYSGAGG